jgi:dephospho-CoA kinase
MIVGLTGGICCGKSTVAKTFVRLGIPEVDADIVARQVVEVGTKGWDRIRATFGMEYLNDDQTINRAKLGKLVFSDRNTRSLLDQLMLPLIIDESKIQLEKLARDHAIVVYNAALICEMGHADRYRPLVVVVCTPEIQLARLMNRNNLTKIEAMLRINAQMPAAAKCDMADFVIETSGNIEGSVLQTEVVLYEIRKLYKVKEQNR